MVIGVAQIIGAGIFVISGVGVKIAGPGILLSFLVAGGACTLAALCYAELAAMIPQSGSAYAYAIFGELPAWIIGWDLILEDGMGASTVAAGWSFYLQDLLRGFGLSLPLWASGPPFTQPGRVINLPAALVVVGFSLLPILRTRLNALLASLIVAVKLAVIAFILILGAGYVQPQNWLPLTPHGTWSVIQAASLVFFAYLGFDVVAITAEESRHPARDVPFGIIGSLVFCSLIYLAAALVLVGMVPYGQVNPDSPFSTLFRQVGLFWAADVVAVGAMIGITSVLYMLMLAQPRVLYAMARDGLLPRWVAGLHPRHRTPHRMTLLCGAAVALVASLTPIEKLAYLCNIGTLFAFFLVCSGVLVLRFSHPELARPFRCPAGKPVAFAGALVSLGLMLSMPVSSWWRLGLWLAAGLVIYFFYGWCSRRLAREDLD